MKISIILLIAAGSVFADTIFWDHPNVQSYLDAPVVPLIQRPNLNILDLISQNPQDQIWYYGGLVGYFPNQWRMPVWSTPWVDWRGEPREIDEPERIYLAPINPFPEKPRVVPDPPQIILEPEKPIIDDVDPPVTPPKDNPELPEPPKIVEPPTTQTPEPNLWAVTSILLAGILGKQWRKARR